MTRETWVPYVSCFKCDGHGVFLCMKGEEPGFWAFRCTCSRGVSDRRQKIPQHKPSDEALGFKPVDLRALKEALKHD